MRIGFTGTQQGMTEKQIAAVRLYLEVHDDVNEVHHGDCIGADSEFHAICMDVKERRKLLKIIIHPPINKMKRAFCKPWDILKPQKDYLDRNLDIVLESDVLIAAPKEYTEQLRSGTWATIRRARQYGSNPPVIIFPNGVKR